jgi:hypothetical protein
LVTVPVNWRGVSFAVASPHEADVSSTVTNVRPPTSNDWGWSVLNDESMSVSNVRSSAGTAFESGPAFTEGRIETVVCSPLLMWLAHHAGIFWLSMWVFSVTSLGPGESERPPLEPEATVTSFMATS